MLGGVSSAGEVGADLVVAGDGSIPAEQLERLGLRPGTRLWVVATGPQTLEGTLPDFPDLAWEDFERASAAARADAARSWG
jgi:hypothetical protein